MDIKQLQDEIENWEKDRFPDAPSYLALIKVLEELGELASHYIHRIEQRVGKEISNPEEGINDAVGDIVISLTVFCVRERIDLSAMIDKVWAEVSQRQFKLDRTRMSKEK